MVVKVVVTGTCSCYLVVVEREEEMLARTVDGVVVVHFVLKSGRPVFVEILLFVVETVVNELRGCYLCQ